MKKFITLLLAYACIPFILIMCAMVIRDVFRHTHLKPNRIMISWQYSFDGKHWTTMTNVPDWMQVQTTNTTAVVSNPFGDPMHHWIRSAPFVTNVFISATEIGGQ